MIHYPPNSDSVLRYVKKNEEYIYAVLWTMAFVAPLIVMAYHSKDTLGYPPPFGWQEVLITWRFTVVFFVVFLIHNLFVAPQLVFLGQRVQYLLQLLLLVVGFQVLQNIVRPPHPHAREVERTMQPMRPHAQNAPGEARPIGRPHDTHPRPPHARAENPDRPHRMPDPMFMFRRNETVMSILLLLILILNIGIKFYFKSEDERQRIDDLQKRNLEQQLEYLKFQINPHFFMNTLNNIHALVDIDPEQAKYMVLVLSKMMRYILYDGERRYIPLKKEVDFILNYVDLMRIRYPQQVKISVDISPDLPDGKVPPLLLITFVENAFKHGVSMRRESFIRLQCRYVPETAMFHLNCVNSKHPTRSVLTQREGGVGLANALRRLKLIYDDNYKLDTVSTDDVYEVHLQVPVNPPTPDDEDPVANQQGANTTH